jgi:acyl carrier protein
MSGKVDRTRLPPPGGEAFPARCEVATGPIGPLEAAVADEWARVLGVSQVSRHDDFFLVGGSSLSAVRMLTALGGRFGIPLRVADFDCQPTIAALADAIERGVADLVESMPERDVTAMLESLRADETDP